MALDLNIIIEQGATFQREFTCTNEETGAAVDLTGYTVDAPLKSAKGIIVADFDYSISFNAVSIIMNEEDNVLLPAQNSYTHKYSVTAKHPTLPDYRIAQGKVMISAQ